MIRKERLANGLTLLTESMPQVRSVAIGVWLRRGSRDEPARLNGISHFIEHLLFKGTETRTAKAIALAMDSIGGQVDAFTSKEYTCFYAKVLDTHVADAVELLADIVQRPAFDPTELERERQVILEEIRMVEDSPDDLVYDLLTDRFYPDQPLGRPIQGTARTVRGMGRGELRRYFREAYRPGDILVVAAGHLTHGRMARLVRRTFGTLAPGPGRRVAPPAPRSRPAIVTRRKSELEQLHLLLGLRAFPERHAARYALYVLNTILGGTMSSRLFQTIREERGLAYAVYSGLNTFLDTGLLTIYAATSPGSAADVVRLVADELRSLRDAGPRREELGMAKEHLKGSLMLALESTSSRMTQLARQQIYFGRQTTPADTLDRVGRVTAAEVQAVARRLFTGGHMALAAVGRVERLRVDRAALAL
jgi:predicted Zn-dependent peptidase